jgi:hypothetical protein
LYRATPVEPEREDLAFPRAGGDQRQHDRPEVLSAGRDQPRDLSLESTIRFFALAILRTLDL